MTDIVCFANDWDGDPLSKKHIMRRLARRGARVLWVNSLGNRAPRLGDAGDVRRIGRKLSRFLLSAAAGPRRVEDRIWTLDPIAAPAYGSQAAGRLNSLLVGWHVRHAARRLGFVRPVHYTFVPASAWVVGRLDESLLVYHAADEYAAFGGADAAAIRALEADLLSRADLFIACSAPLLEAKGGRSRRDVLVRHGVDHAHFARALDPDLPMAAELEGLQRPVLGFFGLIAEWVDLGLLAKLADALRARGGGTVMVVGETRGASAADVADLARRPNVRLVGRRPYAELPRFCRGFDVGLLPFVVNELTVHANPLKLREYLAAGLPVVSTDIPEARTLATAVDTAAPGAVVVASDPDRFVAAAIARALAADAGPGSGRSGAMVGESWDAKSEEIARLLASSPRPRADPG